MNEQETLDFYRQAYQASHARAEALEKSRDRLFEREAQHTEAYGMVCQERDSFKNKLEALRTVARAYRDDAHGILAEDAVCDHSVGICWCGYQASLQALDAVLGPPPRQGGVPCRDENEIGGV